MKGNNTLLVALVVLVALVFMCRRGVSGYMPIKIEPVTEQSIFDLPYELQCVPGPEKTAGYYTKALTPGGICGAQKLVREHSEYKIV